MEELNNILSNIEKKKDNIIMFNIFIKFNKINYLNIFESYVEKIKKIKTYDDCGKYLNNSFIKYKDIILYIKCYVVINELNKDYIIFNDSLYNNLEDINDEDNLIYKNDNETLIFKIENKSKNTKKLINYLLNSNNFINNFIKKRNKKIILLSALWKNEILKNSNKIDINKFNYKKNFDTKIYKETNKKYKIQKFRKIEFLINDEILITSIRLSLPNSFTISLVDNTYVCINKIIISEKLSIGNYVFKNIREKVNFVFQIYKEFFNINIELYNFIFNISIKINNKDKLIYMSNIHALPINQISFTDNYIIMKYINSYKKLLETYELIELYKKKFKKYFKYFNKINSNILYLSNADIDNFFFNK